jgi:DNA-binding protein HU-beta
MKKADIVDAMAKITGQTKAETEKSLQAFVEVVSQNMSPERDIRLVGFGSFSVSERKARKGRNPKTGEPLDIAKKMVPVFKPGKELRDLVNG